MWLGACCENQILVKQQNSKREHVRWIKDHTLAAADKTARIPGWPLWLISPEIDMSHGGTGKQGQRDEKVQNWKDHLWRVWWATHGGEKSNWSQLERSARKIGPVPRQNYFPSRWRIGKVALLLRHCTCIQIFSIQAYLTDHLALLCPSPVQLDQLTRWSTRGHHDLSSPFHPATTSSPKGGSSKELLINNPVAVHARWSLARTVVGV